uniref:Alpha-glucosidase n=1 Tax=Acrobeloides nanus TaxID=290746 RepID=A0A914D7K4_9BILA
NASFIEWPRYDLVPHEVQDQYNLTKNTKIMLGAVWPERNVAFPDFLDTTNNTRDWWANEYKIFHDTKVPFDGIWIDMNEPSNFATTIYYPNTTSASKIRAKRSAIGPENKSPTGDPLKCPDSGPDSEWDNPAYQTINVYQWGNDNYLCSKTLCMIGSTIGGNGRFFDTKNLYGWSEIRSTANALKVTTGKRGEVISRSTFPSSGRYGGHWLGDNTARWEDLATSIIGAQEFNLFEGNQTWVQKVDPFIYATILTKG